MKTLTSDASPRKFATAVMIALFLGVSGSALAGSSADYSGALKDAWLDGRIETAFALNDHLSAAAIDTNFKNGVVVLTGTVKSDIDRDLATELALNIEGVTDVKNDLEVSGESSLDDIADTATKTAGNLMDSVDDATITANVKSRLMANDNIKGLKIDVDTRNDVVTLTRKVKSR